MLSDGLVEVADASAEEFVAAVRAAPADQAQAFVELLAEGISRADLEPEDTPVAQLLRSANPADVPQAAAWLALLEQQSVPPASSAAAGDQSPAPAVSLPQNVTAPLATSSVGPDASPVNAREAAAAAQATAAALEAAAAAKAATTAIPATFSPRPPDEDRWPTTSIPNPGWPRTAPASAAAQAAPPAAVVPAASISPQAPESTPACTPEPQSCSVRPPDASRPGG